MRCEDFKIKLEAYRDGELPLADSQAMAKHLAECRSCSQQLAQRNALGELARESLVFTAPEDLKEELLQTLREQEALRPALERSSGFSSGQSPGQSTELSAGHRRHIRQYCRRSCMNPDSPDLAERTGRALPVPCRIVQL